jgi:dipeptidyl aminopeptidase/acylaminoacyl peptidase
MPVLDDVAYSPTTGIARFDASRTGTLIYRRSRAQAAVMTTLQWVDSTGKRGPLQAKPAVYRSPRIAPDGRRIALGIREGDGSDIWVHDPQRDAQTRLTVGGASEGPVWSPDGQYVVFARRAEGIFQARADGARPPQDLTGSKTDQIPWSFTPDGKRLAYFEGFLRTPQIWTVPVRDEGGQMKAEKPEQFFGGVVNTEPSFSPDGRWLAYHSAESGNAEVYVRAFPPASSGPAGKWQISNNGGREARWSRTGHELIYRSGDQLMSVSYSVKGDTFIAEKPRVWIAALGGTDWDLAPDGTRVVVVVPEAPVETLEAEHQIVMLLYFADELRRKVPVKK